MEKLELPQIPLEVLQSWPQEAQQYVAASQNLLQQLVAQLNELQAKLDQNSQNSSKPPSADPPFKRPPKKPKAKTDQPKGGQVGHPKHERSLLPVEQVDQLVELRPAVCINPACRAPLRSADQLGQRQRHQLWELPPCKAQVTEYCFYTYECSLCQTATTPSWPCQVPQGQFGPQLVATLALLHGQYQLSLRQLQALALDLWQLPLSLGGLADACKKTSQALQTPYHHIEQQVQHSPTLHVDETGWYRAGKLKWLWVAEAPHTTLFKISEGRGHSQLDELIGSQYAGLLHSDRLRTYLKLDPTRHQLCWAHLIRNLRGLAERGGVAQSWGEGMVELSGRLFEVWRRYQTAEGALDREWLREAVQPIRAEFKAGLERGLTLPDGKVKAFCRELVGLEERLYLFVKEGGVEPTNNAAERALRGAVIWRKRCYGNQSRWGEEFVERLLSIGASCQKQGLSLLTFLRQCLEAAWYGHPTPALFALAPTL